VQRYYIGVISPKHQDGLKAENVLQIAEWTHPVADVVFHIYPKGNNHIQDNRRAHGEE